MHLSSQEKGASMKDMITELTRQILPQLEPDERREALMVLQKIIDQNMFDLSVSQSDNDVESCPRCGSAHFVKRGKDANGSQRYLCKRCRRSFTASTQSVLATTKLDRSVWMRFAECHIDMLPLRESAQRCGVCLKTAFFMRHRILEAIKVTIPSFRAAAGDDVQMDECFIPESFSGNRKSSICGIPRKPRHRKSARDQRESICVLVGVNDANDIFYEMTGRGTMNEEEALNVLVDKFESGAIVSTDGAKSYKKVLKKLDVRKHNATLAKEHAINHVNSVHSRLKEFIDHFHGVATRRLDNYLAWFKWMWSFKTQRTSREAIELMLRQVAENPYKTTWSHYKTTPYPFYEYWVKQANWDERARQALPLASFSISKSV